MSYEAWNAGKLPEGARVVATANTNAPRYPDNFEQWWNTEGVKNIGLESAKSFGFRVWRAALASGVALDARGVIVGIADQPLADAARVLAEFAKTAPGRLPQRVQDAIAVVTAGVPACETEQDCTGMPWCRINGKCQRAAGVMGTDHQSFCAGHADGSPGRRNET